MVSVSHGLLGNNGQNVLHFELLMTGLSVEEQKIMQCALEFVVPLYKNEYLEGTGEDVFSHGIGMALIAVSLSLDLESRLAAILFAIHRFLPDGENAIKNRYGQEVTNLVIGLKALNGMRKSTQISSTIAAPELISQTEAQRKMILAMVQDIRVVLLRLASRIQTLRHFSTSEEGYSERVINLALETQEIYAPLANRLGIWQLKWELEDLSFRFTNPDYYHEIARHLGERRLDREWFIADAIKKLNEILKVQHIEAEVFGRPKHIFSIYNKMRNKKLEFNQIYDIRALRVMVPKIAECYKVLDVVHKLWTAIPEQYDDYISKPKGNGYQSLHTAVMCQDKRPMEIQIRTFKMHQYAELGVAAHWKYKENKQMNPLSDKDSYDAKISLLRNLLSWRDELRNAEQWKQVTSQAKFDETVYVLTPQGKVIDLPVRATPLDFAYRLHTEIGHHCRGAKVDGQLVPLNTSLKTGQRIEVLTVKEGGPSLDWLQPQANYVVTSRAKNKIRQYFTHQLDVDLLQKGRNYLTKELQREGKTQINQETLAERLSQKNVEDMLRAIARGDIGPKSLQEAMHAPDAEAGKKAKETTFLADNMVLKPNQNRPKILTDNTILVEGVDKLMTNLARCCKPVPPDPIVGFITRGRGITIHRENCMSLSNLQGSFSERIIHARWGNCTESQVQSGKRFPVDVSITAMDRQGLLKDISEILSREKINLTDVSTRLSSELAILHLTIEVGGSGQLQKILSLLNNIPGVKKSERC